MVYAMDIRDSLPFLQKLGGSSATIGSLLNVIMPLITVIGAFLFMVMALFGGYNWITAGGDQEKLQKAQGTFRTAITGFFIVLMAYTLTKIIIGLFGINNAL